MFKGQKDKNLEMETEKAQPVSSNRKRETGTDEKSNECWGQQYVDSCCDQARVLSTRI